MERKIRILVKPSDVYGCYLFRMRLPYEYIKKNYLSMNKLTLK